MQTLWKCRTQFEELLAMSLPKPTMLVVRLWGRGAGGPPVNKLPKHLEHLEQIESRLWCIMNHRTLDVHLDSCGTFKRVIHFDCRYDLNLGSSSSLTLVAITNCCVWHKIYGAMGDRFTLYPWVHDKQTKTSITTSSIGDSVHPANTTKHDGKI